jgi:RNA polymerase sigma-70 factor (ECF subfamily)
LDDHQLLQAIQQGEAGAFDAFVEKYGRRLLAFGLRMCGQREDAEDVFQDTLVQAYKSLEGLRDPGAVRTWLFRVAANQCRMKRRKEAPGREIPLDEAVPPDLDLAAKERFVDWSQQPLDAAQRSQTRRLLEAALEQLPADYRMVILLRDVEGLSTQETADALGLGLSAVKMRLHRARLELRQRLDAHFKRQGALA